MPPTSSSASASPARSADRGHPPGRGGRQPARRLGGAGPRGQRHVPAVRGGAARPARLPGRLDHLVRAGPRRGRVAGHPAGRSPDRGRRHGAVRRDRRVPASPAGHARRQPRHAPPRHRRGRPALAEGAGLERDAGRGDRPSSRHAPVRVGGGQRGRRGRRPVRRDRAGRCGRDRPRLRRDRSAGGRRRPSPRGRRGAHRRRRDRGQPGGAARAARSGGAAMGAGRRGPAHPTRLGRPAGSRERPRSAARGDRGGSDPRAGRRWATAPTVYA